MKILLIIILFLFVGCTAADWKAFSDGMYYEQQRQEREQQYWQQQQTQQQLLDQQQELKRQQDELNRYKYFGY